tara:strand:+ start:274 stop:735 length:462 start_codon:yes stop_codon:yes gene_type:complete
MKHKPNKVKKLPEFKSLPSVLLVVAPYYPDITTSLVDGAKEVLLQATNKIEQIEVPGALEIPTAINFASSKYSGFVALGCVIRGETTHYETVTSDSSSALSQLGLQGICIGNGILTVENYEQAIERANPSKQNKGGNAAEALLWLLAIKERFL